MKQYSAFLIIMLASFFGITQKINGSAIDLEIIAELVYCPANSQPVSLVRLYADRSVDINDKKMPNILDKNIFKKCIYDLNQSGITNDALLLRRNYVGPSSAFVRMNAYINGHSYSLSSWHPIFHNSKNLIITQNGVYAISSAITDRPPEQSKAYKGFLKVWKQTEDVFDQIILTTTKGSLDLEKLMNEQIKR